MLTKLLGANWQTTLWGGIFAVASAVAVSPALVEFLPDSIEGYVKGVAALIMAATGIKFAAAAKAANVTGGTIQQTADGKVAAQVSQSESSSVTETIEAKPKP